MSALLWEFGPMVGAGLLAVFLEYQYRAHPESWQLWYLCPYVLMSYLLWMGITRGPSLLLAIVAFNFVTLLARSGVSHFLLGEPIVRGNLVAFVCLLAAMLAGKFWR